MYCKANHFTNIQLKLYYRDKILHFSLSSKQIQISIYLTWLLSQKILSISLPLKENLTGYSFQALTSQNRIQ